MLKSQKIGMMFISLIVLSLFILPVISSFEFDNTANYNNNTKEYTIRNAWGYGGDLSKIKLEYNTYECSDKCFAEGHTILFEPAKLIDTINFLKIPDKEQTNLEYKFLIKNGTKTIPKEITQLVCITDNVYENGSIEKHCYNDIIGMTTEEITNWIPYAGQILPNGNYKWRIEGTKKPQETIDWVINTQGIQTTEWALWNAVIGTGLVDDFNRVLIGENFTTGDIPVELGTNGVRIINNNLYINNSGGFDLNRSKWNQTLRSYSPAITYEFKFKTSQLADTNFGTILFGCPDKVCSTDISFHRIFVNSSTLWVQGGTTNGNNKTLISDNNWYIARLKINLSANKSEFFVNDIGIGNLTFQTNATNYTWWSYNTPSSSGATPDRNISIDYIEFGVPILVSIYQNEPADLTSSTSTTQTFNCSAQSAEVTPLINNISLYIDGVKNYTNDTSALSLNSVSLYRNITGLIVGKHNWSCDTTDNLNNRYSTSNRTFEIVTFIEGGLFQNITSNETATETFKINLTNNIPILSIDATLNFANKVYTSTSSCSGTVCTLSNTLDMPLITGLSQNKSFYWNITFYDGSGSYFKNTSVYYKNISRINMSECSTAPTINFTVYDESNLSRVMPFYIAGTMSYWLGTGSVKRNVSIYNISVLTEKGLCLSANQTTYIEGYLEYNGAGLLNTTYGKRNIYIVNESINQVTTDKKLYLLKSVDSTSFIQKVLENIIAVPNAYIYAYRYYAGTDEWILVQTTRTDGDGKTMGFYEAETALYKHTIKLNNIIRLNETDGRIMIPDTVPYTVVWDIGGDIENPMDVFKNITGIDMVIWYNNNTKIVSINYTDINTNFSEGRFYVIQEKYSTEDLVICNTTSALASVRITCNVSSYTGSFIATGYITEGGIESAIQQLRFKISDAIDTFGKDGLLIAFFIILTSAFVFLWNPIAGIIAVDIAIIFVNLIGFVSFGGVFIFGILMASIIAIWLLKD